MYTTIHKVADIWKTSVSVKSLRVAREFRVRVHLHLSSFSLSLPPSLSFSFSNRIKSSNYEMRNIRYRRAFNEEITLVYKLTDPRERGTHASSRSSRSVDDSLWKRKLSGEHRLAATHDTFVSRQYWRSYNDTIVGAVDRAQPSKWLCKLTRVLSNEITFGRRRDERMEGDGEKRKGTWWKEQEKDRVETT